MHYQMLSTFGPETVAAVRKFLADKRPKFNWDEDNGSKILATTDDGHWHLKHPILGKMSIGKALIEGEPTGDDPEPTTPAPVKRGRKKAEQATEPQAD